MPRFDGTGPAGHGPLTGRGMGPCGDGTYRGGYYRGFGFGGRQFVSPKNQMALLEAQERDLEEQLTIIREEKEALGKEAK